MPNLWPKDWYIAFQDIAGEKIEWSRRTFAVMRIAVESSNYQGCCAQAEFARLHVYEAMK